MILSVVIWVIRKRRRAHSRRREYKNLCPARISASIMAAKYVEK